MTRSSLEWIQSDDAFGKRAQGLATRRQNLGLRHAGGEPAGEDRRRRKDVFAIVQHHQHLTLPKVETFVGLSIVIGCVLVPVGILSLQTWQTSVFKSLAIFFRILLAPANLMTFDSVQYYNQGVAVVVGMGSAAIGFLLLPPLSSAARVSRILDVTLRDLRRLAAGRQRDSLREWENRLYRRLADMPAAVGAEQLARFVAMLSMGSIIIRLRRLARRFKMEAEIDTAFAAVAARRSAAAMSYLAAMERELRKQSIGEAEAMASLQVCGGILAALHTLTRYEGYFDGFE